MSTAQVAISDWQALYKTTYNAVYIGEVCQTLPQEIVIFNKVWAECVCVCVHVCVCVCVNSPPLHATYPLRYPPPSLTSSTR